LDGRRNITRKVRKSNFAFHSIRPMENKYQTKQRGMCNREAYGSRRENLSEELP